MTDAWNPPGNGNGGGGWSGPGEAVAAGLPSWKVFGPVAVLQQGWAVLKEQPVLVLLGGACLFGLQVVPSFLAMPLQAATTALVSEQISDPAIQSAVEGVWGLIMSVFAMPFHHLVVAGLYLATARWMMRDEQDLFALFTSVVPALRSLITGIVCAIVSMAVLALLVAPPTVGSILLFRADLPVAAGLLLLLLLPAFLVLAYVQLGLILATVAAVLDGLGPVAAIDASWKAARGARIPLLLTGIVLSTLSVLGCCLFGLPVVVVLGLSCAGFASAWLLHRRSVEETAQWGLVQRNLGALYEG